MNSFLNKHSYKKSSDDEITHTRIKNSSLDIVGGAYTIKGDDLETFHKYYYNPIIKIESVEYLTEKQLENGMLCIDFDLLWIFYLFHLFDFLSFFFLLNFKYSHLT